MAPRRSLICGVSGQDGAYLARLLLSKGYEVVGASRDAQMVSHANLERLGIDDQVQIMSMDLSDFRSTLQVVARTDPDEIYNLAGQTSVGLSFDQPAEALESVSIGTLNLLEAIRYLGRPMRFFNASSSECFGDTGTAPASEETAFRPRSPYAVAKSAAHWTVASYRNAYGIHASNGILFNHESPLRPSRFVVKKIVVAACAIAGGSGDKLRLGNVAVCRDWGYAEEYVDAMWQIVRQDRPDDFVVATGRTTSLSDLVAAVFAEVGLDWRDHVLLDERLLRPFDIEHSAADPQKAHRVLGWQARTGLPDLIRLMVAHEREHAHVADEGRSSRQ